jgi:hypothetical protein
MAEEIRLVQLVPGGENNGREEEVKEELVVEGDTVLEVGFRGKADDQTNEHA